MRNNLDQYDQSDLISDLEQAREHDKYESNYPSYADNATGWVYIIHFETPWVSEGRDGKTRILTHYVGFSKRPAARLYHHRLGDGSNFLAHAGARGIKFTEVVQFRGSKADERRLKNVGHTDRYCPVCAAKAGKNAHKFQARGVLPHEQEYREVRL